MRTSLRSDLRGTVWGRHTLMICVIAFPRLLVGQGSGTVGIGVEIAADGGRVSVPRPTSEGPGAAGLLLGTVQGGVRTELHAGSANATASVALAAAMGAHGMLPIGTLGLATRRGPLTLSFALEQGVGMGRTTTQQMTVVPGRDTFPSSQRPITLNPSTPAFRRTSDVVGGIGTRLKVVHLQLVAGMRMPTLVRHGVWMGANAEADLGGGSALTVAVRRQDDQLTVRAPSLSLGLRMTHFLRRLEPARGAPLDGQSESRRAAVVTADSSGDTITLRLYLPGAHRAVVAGDATDWQPVAMARQQGGWWMVALPAPAPVSRLHMRKDDGAWCAVPGLPATHDEYGGTISLLVVPRGRDQHR